MDTATLSNKSHPLGSDMHQSSQKPENGSLPGSVGEPLLDRRGFLQASCSSLLLLAGCSRSEGPSVVSTTLSDDQVSQAVLQYLADPTFSGKNLLKSLTGNDVELVQLVRGKHGEMAYFSHAYSRDQAATEVFRNISQLSRKPEKIEIAELESGRLRFPDGISMKQSPQRGFLVRFDSADFIIARDAKATKHFTGGIEYDVSAEELAHFLRNESVKGGLISIDTGVRRSGREIAISNHDPFVAVRGEPSLTRFVQGLISGAASREERVQRLTDFVSSQIAYSEREANFGVETFKRPNEVLLSGEADCSGKVTLLASLLEQISENYIYLIDFRPDSRAAGSHIALGIEKGNFRAQNGISELHLDEKSYVLIESTTAGYQIGKTRLEGGDLMSSFTHIQRPGEAKLILLHGK